MPKNPTVAARTPQGAGTARKNYYSRESFAQVPTRKSLLLRRKRRSFAFGKTTALLFTIIVVSMAAQALNERADSTDNAQPQISQSALLAEPTPAVRIYDIPLAEELQAFTFYLCEDYGTDYEMVLALMDRESDYTASAISKTNDYGIMQINKINHKWLTEELGTTDFLDPEQNIRCGVYMIGKLTAKYDDPHRVLMAYNMGESGARNYAAKGNTSSAYSRYIMELRDKLLQGGGEE